MNMRLIVNKSWFALKKASPTIAVAGGVVFGIIGTVEACRATLKVDEVLDKAKADVKKIHETAEDPKFAAEYTQDKMQRDLAVVYTRTAAGLGRLYGKAIVCGAVSIALIFSGHRALLKRTAALGATVTILSDAYKRYRANVAEQYGEEAERDIYNGVRKERIEEVVTDEETGKEKKVKSDVKVVEETKMASPYAVCFDSTNPNYRKDDVIYNVDFLTDVQTFLNQKLQRQGWMFLNEVRMALGYKPVPEGQVVGWVYNDKDPNCSCCIDFGIDHINREDVRAFRNGYERTFVIDFNVDGPIIETFHLFDKSNRAA